MLRLTAGQTQRSQTEMCLESRGQTAAQDTTVKERRGPDETLSPPISYSAQLWAESLGLADSPALHLALVSPGAGFGRAAAC